MGVRSLHGPTRNGMGSEIFVPNKNLASFAGHASRDFIDSSPDTVDSLREEIMSNNPAMSEGDAHDQAMEMMSAAHSLAAFSSGDAPVRQSWDEVFQIMGFDPSSQKLIFNSENTRVTVAQAIRGGTGSSTTAADPDPSPGGRGGKGKDKRKGKGKGQSSARAKGKGKARADDNSDDEEDESDGGDATTTNEEAMISDAFVFVPHQPIGKYNSILWIDHWCGQLKPRGFYKS